MITFVRKLARLYPFRFFLSESAHPSVNARPTGPTVISSTTAINSDEVNLVVLKDFYSRSLANQRTVEIYLPPGYATGDRSYPVLYANDGQDMTALRLKSTLTDLYKDGTLELLVVVAVYAATGERINEYGTASSPNSMGQGRQAALYQQFLTTELLPYINEHYRTLTDPTHTAVMGASLGGLSAFDTAWCHPALFGKVGVFSGSFWWRTDDRGVAAQQASRIMHKLIRQSPTRDGLQMWFEAGTQDESADRDRNGVIDAIQDTTELMDELRLKGYRIGQDMVYVEVAGGKHNQETWAKVLPDFLKWAFPA